MPYGTLSNEFPGWYITFQTDVLSQLPRPGELSEVVADQWHTNRESMKKALRDSFCPPEKTDIATEFTNLILTERLKRRFATWKVIKLGTHKTVKDLTKGLTDAGFRIGAYSAQILKKITISSAEEIELVNVSGVELGFDENVSRAEIYAHATTEYGLNLVPNEAGPQLRRQYPDQPQGEWLLMAMEPLPDSDDGLDVFNIVHGDDGQWLSTVSGGPDGVWDPDGRWVFARRKQNQSSDVGSLNTV